ncbi:MAG: hypothetical protein V9F01_09290 [Chitinophagaceae bacterium]
MNKIAITSDVDWAPEPVLEYMISLFEARGIKCTFFCTHYSEVLLNADRNLFELAIHPNFNPLLDGKAGNSDEVLDKILAIYPESRGVRSHSMLQSTGLINLFSRKGLIYESNHFLPYHKNISPFLLWNGMVRLPYIWEDDIHWLYGNSFADLKINLNEPGMKIFDFHPIHIYLNTTNEEHYLNAKPFYQQPLELQRFRNSGKDIKGAKDALEKLFQTIEGKGLHTFLLKEIAAEVQKTTI